MRRSDTKKCLEFDSKLLLEISVDDFWLKIDEKITKIRYVSRWIIIDRNWKIALLSFWKWKYFMLPWWKIEEFENAKKTLKKEIKEEIGVRIKNIRFIWCIKESRVSFVANEIWKKAHINHTFWFFAEVNWDKWNPDLEEWEKKKWLKVMWLDYSEVVDIIKNYPKKMLISKFRKKRDLRFLEELKYYLNNRFNLLKLCVPEPNFKFDITDFSVRNVVKVVIMDVDWSFFMTYLPTIKEYWLAWGWVNEWEKLLSAVKREVAEETWFDIEIVKYLWTIFAEKWYSERNANVYWFLAKIIWKNNHLKMDDYEIELWLEIRKFKNIKDMIIALDSVDTNTRWSIFHNQIAKWFLNEAGKYLLNIERKKYSDALSFLQTTEEFFSIEHNVLYESRFSVRGIIYDLDWKISILKSKKYWYTMFPWWWIEYWENVLSALKREIFEEVWVKIKDISFFTYTKDVFVEEKDNLWRINNIFWFIAKIDWKKWKQHLEKDEREEWFDVLRLDKEEYFSSIKICEEDSLIGKVVKNREKKIWELMKKSEK